MSHCLRGFTALTCPPSLIYKNRSRWPGSFVFYYLTSVMFNPCAQYIVQYQPRVLEILVRFEGHDCSFEVRVHILSPKCFWLVDRNT